MVIGRKFTHIFFPSEDYVIFTVKELLFIYTCVIQNFEISSLLYFGTDYILIPFIS